MKKSKTGAALFTLMITLVFATSVAAVVVYAAKQTAFGAVRTFDYVKAQAYAEAGANMAYAILRDNFSYRTDPSRFPSLSIGDGSFIVTVTPVSSNLASIVSQGVCRRASYTVWADIRNFAAGAAGGGGRNDPADPYSYAVLSGSSQDWSGSGTLEVRGGSVHANSEFEMTGSGNVKANVSSSSKITLKGSSKIQGNARAPSISAGSGNITGTRTITNVPPVRVPTIDFAPYFAEAQKNGQVRNGDFHYTGSSDLVIPGGVLWVNGKFRYSGSGRVIGCIIATGDIDWSGSGDQVKVGNLPALMSRDGSINISGSSQFHGLIYTRVGNFDKSGSGKVTGSILAAGEFRKTGSWSLMDYQYSLPTAPGQPATPPDDVRITAWQK